MQGNLCIFALVMKNVSGSCTVLHEKTSSRYIFSCKDYCSQNQWYLCVFSLMCFCTTYFRLFWVYKVIIYSRRLRISAVNTLKNCHNTYQNYVAIILLKVCCPSIRICFSLATLYIIWYQSDTSIFLIDHVPSFLSCDSFFKRIFYSLI